MWSNVSFSSLITRAMCECPQINMRAFSVYGAANKLAIINMTAPANPVVLEYKDFTAESLSPNSVASKGGVFAVAFQGVTKTVNGKVRFYSPAGAMLKEVTVGAQPDMVTFTPDGKYVLTANEGEPVSYPATVLVDPQGSVSIIDIQNGIGNATVTHVTFTSLTTGTLEPGVRIFGPNASIAQDIEPEYIAVSSDSTTAYVTLQENNAIAIIHIPSATLTRVAPLGTKDFSVGNNKFDASDTRVIDPVIDIKNWPVKGLYQPDGIATFTFNGYTYLMTANEGDSRTDWPGYVETARLSTFDLDDGVFGGGMTETTLKNAANLGRLTVSKTGNTNTGDADLEEIQLPGGRSFSIWNTSIVQQFDSADQMEQFIATDHPDFFNASHTSNAKKNRSDDKGPEPETLITYAVGGRQFATVGLERDSGLMNYELVSPTAPAFLNYATGRKFNETPANNSGGDLGPEGLLFISAAESPNGKPLILVSNEISGTIGVWQVRAINEIASGLQFTISGMARNNKSTFTGKLKFWNRTTEPIQGPFYFIPRNIEGGAFLTNPTGTFQDEKYIEIPAGALQPNGKIEIDIEFTPGPGPVNPGRVTFEPHIYIGSL